MQFTTIALALFASVNAATVIKARQAPYTVCPAIDTPLCCQADVDGVLDLTCEAPAGTFSDIDGFKKVCSETGLTAECCTLPALGDALLCSEP